MKRSARVVAVVCAAVVVGVAGCTSTVVPSAEEHPITAPTPALQKLYDQRVTWESCQGNDIVNKVAGDGMSNRFTCATVTVPVNYDNPDGEKISLQLVRYSRDNDNPPLIYNPGGPGGSAVQSLPGMVRGVFSDRLLGSYDIVAVDPRGVGTSSPLNCRSAAEIDHDRSQPAIPIDTPPNDIISQLQEDSAAMGKKCLEANEGLTTYMDTVSAARDLDVIRAALGQDTLNYFGFSYGTFLGATYLDMFGKNAGRFVLDGALDPSIGIEEVAAGQAAGFEASLGHWIEMNFDDPEFPFNVERDVDRSKAALKQWVDGLDADPLPTSDPDRTVGTAVAWSAIMAQMYSLVNYTNATTAVKLGYTLRDGSMLLQIADLYADREPDGTYATNASDAFTVVNALDYPVTTTPEEWARDAEKLVNDYPTVGENFAYSAAAVAAWPVKSRATRGAVHGEDAGPVLVIGTHHDPATPYPWAKSLASQLKSATLVSWNGWDHCAYRIGGSQCVVRIVDDYFINGTVPEEGSASSCPATE